ncbi:MAG TPA: ImmA/IrrE family metallo-endopeptidase [Solirubrobacteraceae bacterium]|jgi:Zn-dependent peptidase ImmA (M78 family)|nr:ImmA/IrrE family metallo-endopeptidase [Solirubrobacteraceae bacterium]
MNPERDAQEMLQTYWAKEDGTLPLPVDPIAIAGKLGIKVFTAVLEPNVSGMLFMRPGSDPEIYLSQSDSYNRQRFTCAHELGHWSKRVAAGEESAHVVDYRGPLAATGNDSQEIYANQFAAALLMPAPEVLRLKERGYSPIAVADELRVSPEAASFRIANLDAD